MKGNIPSPEKLRISLRIVFYQESDFWVAHCLEMDVMGHGKDKDEALTQLSEAISLQITASIAANNHRNIFMPADPKFFEMYAAGKDVADAEIDLVVKATKKIKYKDDVSVQEVEARQYRGVLEPA